MDKDLFRKYHEMFDKSVFDKLPPRGTWSPGMLATNEMISGLHYRKLWNQIVRKHL